MDAREAMLRAGPVRLRPILMTSIATLMAAVPSALALGPGAEIRAPMAAAVIGGLVVSTALSLLVVPAFYVVTDRGSPLLAEAERQAGEPAPAELVDHAGDLDVVRDELPALEPPLGHGEQAHALDAPRRPPRCARA